MPNRNHVWEMLKNDSALWQVLYKFANPFDCTCEFTCGCPCLSCSPATQW